MTSSDFPQAVNTQESLSFSTEANAVPPGSSPSNSSSSDQKVSNVATFPVGDDATEPCPGKVSTPDSQKKEREKPSPLELKLPDFPRARRVTRQEMIERLRSPGLTEGALQEILEELGLPDFPEIAEDVD